MKEVTSKDIEKLEKERDSLYKKANDLSNKIKELKIKTIGLEGFEGKYIKYEEEEGYPEYMLVDWVTKDCTWHKNFDYSYLFRGLGFYGEFTGYGDATMFSWSYWHEFYIYGHEGDFQEKIKKIQIITKEEFESAFEEMLNKVKEYHGEFKRKV